ncbi:MAG: hypothetical protein WC827_04220 [Candidatus Paceibacterota bacterium]|jgi:hypothetical protein
MEQNAKISAQKQATDFVSDIIKWQNQIKEKVDINKLDSELDHNQAVQKVIYFALEKTAKEIKEKYEIN